MLRIQTASSRTPRLAVALVVLALSARSARGVDPIADCNQNGVPDAEEIAAGGADCDGNGVLDVCELDTASVCPDPTHCSIGGVPTTALGGAHLSLVEADGQRALAVDGLEGNGESGIAQDLAALGGVHEAGLRLLPPNLAGAVAGAELEVGVATGAADGKPPMHARVSIQSSGFSLLVDLDLATLAPPPYELRAFRAGELVAIEHDLDVARLATAPGDVAAIVFRQSMLCLAEDGPARPCDGVQPCPGECRETLVAGIEFPLAVVVNVPGRGELEADRVEIVPVLAPMPPRAFHQLELRGRSLGRLLIALGDGPRADGADCDGNGVPDACDIAAGASDCDGNGVPDACEIRDGLAADCNQDGVPDACDIAAGANADADGNGVPDECEDIGPTPRDLYEEVLADAERLRRDGVVPEETIEFLLVNEALFATDPDALAEAVFATEVGEAPAGVEFGAGGGAASGFVDGINWVLYSNRRIPVGIMRPVIRWNNHADPCTCEIIEHFFMGGVINGVCRTEQTSGIVLEGCPPTGTCTVPVRECTDVRVVCMQTVGTRTTGILTPAERLCAQCAEFPGGQIPGDCNADGRVDIADPSCLFGFLFLGAPAALPCGDGTGGHSANVALLDWNDDGTLDLSDGVGTLNWLFSGGPDAPGHVLGRYCRQIVGCVENCNP